MFGARAFRLGSLFGIPIEVDASWFLIFFLVAMSLSTSYLPEAIPDAAPSLHVLIATAMALAFFASIVLHELAHSLVARAGGLKVSRVTLFVFVGVSQMQDEPVRPRHEFLLAIAGPGMSLLLGGLGYGLLAVLGTAAPIITVPIRYLAVINISVAAFNLLPGFPLDGGRVLRSLLWAITRDKLKATKWASASGRALGYALVAFAVFGVLQGMTNLVWLAVMGWFLAALASSAYRQQLIRTELAEIPLSRIMTSPVDLVPADVTLEEMAHSFFLGGRHARYPVVDDGRVVGLIELQATREVPRDKWRETTAADAAYRDLAGIVATPDTPVDRVLSLMEPSARGAVLVVDDGRLAGIVTRSDVIRLLNASSPRNAGGSAPGADAPGPPA
jgi:Zn-dependent protease/predicted transcriptional regulator